MAFKFLFIIAFAFLISSCSVLNQGYVPVAYEPLQLSSTKTTRVSTTVSSSFAKVQLAHAIKPNIGIAINEAYGFGASNTEAIISYFKTKESSSFEIGLGTGFQKNNSNYFAVAKTIPENILYLNKYTYYNEYINASYQTLFLCGAYFLNSANENHKIGLCLKSGGAYIYDYNYDVKAYTEDGNASPKDEEHLQFKNATFFSAEASILYMLRIKRAGLRLQAGYNYCSSAIQHNYYFEQAGFPFNNFMQGSRNHPTYNAFIFSMGIVFTLNKKKE